MKRFSLQFAIALITFLIGVGFAAFWLLTRPLPEIDLPQNPPECAAELDAKIDSVDLQVEWRAMLLERFREIPLKELPANVDESYRLIWIPTFDDPTIIRIWRSGENYFIVTKRLNRNKNNLEIGKLKFEKTHSITAEEWQSFVSLLQQRCYWVVPSKIEEPIVMDGASWTLEGISNGKYHLVYRTLPSAQMSGIFRELFKLTGVEMEHERYL